MPAYIHVLSLTCVLYTASDAFDFKLSDFPFRNTSLPLKLRVDDLVSRLNLDELVEQMSRGGGGGDGGPVPAIPRLGIGKYWWGTECIHGEIFGMSTAFPQSIGLSAAFKYVNY